jgi:hypothetical protein
LRLDEVERGLDAAERFGLAQDEDGAGEHEIRDSVDDLALLGFAEVDQNIAQEDGVLRQIGL